MMPTSFGEAHTRIENLLKKFSLTTSYKGDIEAAIPFISHDKKASSGKVSIVLCEKIGECYLKTIPTEEFIKTIKDL